jgi:hypothetical protein
MLSIAIAVLLLDSPDALTFVGLHHIRTSQCSYTGSELGFDPTPIYVETAEGRKLYQELQLQLYIKAQPVRLALLQAYDELLLSAQQPQQQQDQQEQRNQQQQP